MRMWSRENRHHNPTHISSTLIFLTNNKVQEKIDSHMRFVHAVDVSIIYANVHATSNSQPLYSRFKSQRRCTRDFLLDPYPASFQQRTLEGLWQRTMRMILISNIYIYIWSEIPWKETFHVSAQEGFPCTIYHQYRHMFLVRTLA